MQNSENNKEPFGQVNTTPLPENKSERINNDVITERKRQENLNIILRDLAVKLSAVTELDEGLRLCLEAAIEISGLDCGGVYLVDDASGSLDMAFHKGLSPDFVRFVLRYEADSDSARLVMRGKPVYMQYQQLDVPLDEMKKREGLRAIAVIPMLHKGRIVGCINIASHTLWEVPPWSRMVLETIAAQISGTVVRLRAERALRESENRYKAVIDNAEEGIVVVQDRMLKFVNPYLITIMGHSEKELTSRPFIEFVHPDDQERVMEIHLRRFKGEKVPETYEFKFIDKQGNAKWVENNGILIEWGGRPATLNFLRDITERRKTEKELRKQRYYLEKAQDIGHIGTWELDIGENILVWTDENYRIFGVPKGTELTYEVFLNYVHPDDREYVDKKWKAAFDKEPYDIEHRLLVDGEVRWVREKAELDFDEKGNCVRGIGFTQDITNRKKAEEQMRQERNIAQKYLDIAEVMFVVIDTDQKVRLINQKGCKILGYNEKDIIDKNWFDNFLPESIRKEVKTVFKKLVAGEIEPIEYFENYVLTKDGDEKLIAWHNTVLRDKQGRITATLASGEDITERKKTEEKIRKLSTAVNQSPSVIVITDLDGNMEYVNPKFCELTGYSNEEAISQNPRILRSGEQPDEVYKELWETISSGNVWRGEFHNKKKNGELYWEAASISPIFDKQGKRINYIKVAEDITKHKRAEQKIIEDREQLKSLASQLSVTEERERRRIATELHDQIGQSLVFSKLKLDELHQSATSSELIKALDEICNNILQVIQDTRTLTFDLCSPILSELGLEAAVTDWLDVQIREKHGIETEFKDDGQKKPLDDDIRALLFRNVRELLVNVIKHAHAHKVKVSIRRVNEHIHINVEDDGKGFDSVKVTSTATEETKFGLFSIRERLEHLGGSFEIKSEERRGSKFTMTAPLKLMKSQK